MKLNEEDFPTVPLLIKSYTDLDTIPMIPHLVKEVRDFKASIKPYIVDGKDRLVGHAKPQQFWFHMRNAIQTFFEPHPMGAHVEVS